MTISIRRLTEADLDAADAVLQVAYGGTTSRRQRLRRYIKIQPDGWLFATFDGVPAGVAGAIDYGPLAYIGLVGVHPSLQRRGIAQAIMERLLGWIDERGCPVAMLDASPMGAPLYVKLGFVDDGATLLFKRDGTALLPPRSAHVTRLLREDIPALVEFDAPIFGASREIVFSLLLGDEPERAFVARGANGQISGYAFAQTQVIGPWVARTVEDAEALLGATLPLEYTSLDIIVPRQNADAAGLLARYGFSQQRALRHMVRGASTSPGQRQLLYGQASLAIG